MTVPALPPGTRPGTGGYTSQLPPVAPAVGQVERVASVSGKHAAKEWYTPVTQQDITDAVSSFATTTYVDGAISGIVLPTRDSLGLNTDDAVSFGSFGLNSQLRWQIQSGRMSAFAYGQRSLDITNSTVQVHKPFRLSGSNTSLFSQLESISGTALAVLPEGGLIQQRNGANPQQLQIYEQFTNDSNRSYLSIRAQTGGDFVIEPVGVGATQRKLQLGSSVILPGLNSARLYLGSVSHYLSHFAGGIQITANNSPAIRSNISTTWIESTKFIVENSVAFWDGTPPATQPGPIADATDPTTTQSAVNTLLAAVRSYGLIAA